MLGNNSMKQTLIGRPKNVLKCEKNANLETSGHFLDVPTNVNIPTSEIGVSHSLKTTEAHWQTLGTPYKDDYKKRKKNTQKKYNQNKL